MVVTLQRGTRQISPVFVLFDRTMCTVQQYILHLHKNNVKDVQINKIFNLAHAQLMHRGCRNIFRLETILTLMDWGL